MKYKVKPSNILLLILMLFVSPITAGGSNIQSAFIDDVVGARARALGGAYTTLVDDASALIWNPAAMQNFSNRHNLKVAYGEIIDFLPASYIGYGKKQSEDFAFGLGVFFTGDEIMMESIGYLGFAFDGSLITEPFFPSLLPKELINIGISTKFLYSDFGNNSSGDFLDIWGVSHQVSGSAYGLSFDLGVLAETSSKDLWSMTLKNVVNRVWWESSNEAGSALGNYTENLPTLWTVGYARKEEKFNLALDLRKSINADDEDQFAFGFEYFLRPDFHLRTGYAQELVTADNKQFSFGAGFRIANPIPLTFNLAYQIRMEWENHNSLVFSLRLH